MQKKPSKSSHVVVSVDAGHQEKTKLAAVVKKLRNAGLRGDSVLDAVGLVTGHVDDSHLEHLKSVPGVSAVEQQGAYHLPPPDADVQ